MMFIKGAVPTRRKILSLLKNWDLNVSELSEHFSISTASLSYHLNILCLAGLVREKRGQSSVLFCFLSLYRTHSNNLLKNMTKEFLKLDWVK